MERKPDGVCATAALHDRPDVLKAQVWTMLRLPEAVRSKGLRAVSQVVKTAVFNR